MDRTEIPRQCPLLEVLQYLVLGSYKLKVVYCLQNITSLVDIEKFAVQSVTMSCLKFFLLVLISERIVLEQTECSGNVFIQETLDFLILCGLTVHQTPNLRSGKHTL
jgi:hypothetical protein